MAPFLLTAEQRSMLFLAGIFGPGIFHNVSFGMPISTSLSTADLNAAVRLLSERHESLRTALAGSSAFVQRIRAAVPEIVRSDVLDEGSVEAFARRRNEMHNVSLAPGVAYFEVVGGRHLLGVVDHLVSDGHSSGILSSELGRLLAGEELEPAASFTALQKARRVDDGARAREVEHWRRTLADLPPLVGRMPRSSGDSSDVRTQVDDEISGSGFHDVLRGLVERHRATPFSILAGLVGIAIWRRSGRREFTLHTPVSTRREAASRTMVGNFVLDRPIPIRIDPDMDFMEFAGRLQTSAWNGLRHSKLSVPELVCEVPEYGESLLAQGADYIQLHVDVQTNEATDVVNSPGGSTGPVVLGGFTPAHDLTVTTLRFRFSERRLFTRTFFGGPREGIAEAEGIRADVLTMLRGADLHGKTVGSVADSPTLVYTKGD
ncbi:condensation domain-containing protein [Streptosporangium carneum]|uniref:Condensation domain-containing protein n=1 Tax=Streptosporangium carneum TaxID=47481 RepID=A0A9W6I6Y2_9ACTN|nr:condensation domain-containing protein [Streptosporangium carneum]GLK13200.1 hypothetical protein GCM10017600_66110 [Streptosporangium carneum]